MREDMKIAALLVMLFAESTRGDTFYNMLNRDDPCISLCEKTPAGFSNVWVSVLCPRWISHCASYTCLYIGNFFSEHVCEVLLSTRLQILQFGRSTFRIGVEQFEWHQRCLWGLYVYRSSFLKILYNFFFIFIYNEMKCCNRLLEKRDFVFFLYKTFLLFLLLKILFELLEYAL